VPSINNNNNNNNNNLNNNNNNNNKYNSFHDILTPIQQLKNISNKLSNNTSNNSHSNNISNNNNNNNNVNNSSNSKIETRPASTPSSSILPPPLQNVEQFSSMLGEEIVNNWRHTSFIDLPPPMSSSIGASSSNSQQQSNMTIGPTSSSHLSKLTTSMHNRMINQFPNFTDCLSTPQHHHHHHQHQHHHHMNNQNHLSHDSGDKNSHNEASSTASTPILQEGRSDDNINSRGGVTTPMSLPPMSKSPSEDNHPLLHNGTGPLSIGGLQFNPFGSERGNNHNHYKFADEMHLPLGHMAGRLGDSLIPKGDPMEARLQEMLRYNMDKYANQNLDTLHISRRVRELLSVHNIGQRLFAKYVLGLSQGTVSELLSKPKPWDKLTEKGRDSYRKMHAWACDDQAILLLKSLIPKKGKSNFLYILLQDGDAPQNNVKNVKSLRNHSFNLTDCAFMRNKKVSHSRLKCDKNEQFEFLHSTRDITSSCHHVHSTISKAIKFQ